MSIFLDGVENLIRETIREEVTAILDKRGLPIVKEASRAERDRPPSDRLLKVGEVAPICVTLQFPHQTAFH
jgi:hypothetical protein